MTRVWPEENKQEANGGQLDGSPPVWEDGHPSPACCKLPPLLSEARPKDFFDTQLTPPEFLSWVVKATNLRAYSSGAESGKYKDFLPFNLNKLNKMIGILIVNGLLDVFFSWVTHFST